MKAFDSQPVKLVVVFRNAGFTANLVLISGVVLVPEVELLTLTGLVIDWTQFYCLLYST